MGFLDRVFEGQGLNWETFDDPQTILLTDAFAESIGKLPPGEKADAIKRLHWSLKAAEVEIRRRAALTLGCLGDKSGVPTMIDDLPKAQGRDRDNVVVALRILKDERAAPALRKAIKDKSPYVRGIAAAALGELKVVKAYDDIIGLTGDKEGKNGESKNGGLNCLRTCPAEMACYALGTLGDKRAIPVLIELLSDDDIQESALQALETLTDKKFGRDSAKWKAWWSDHD
jgi:HEAT repeat protein